VIYFLHIPKTGGTSTSDLLRRLMPPGSAILGPVLLDDLLRPENRNWKSADLLMGHLGLAPLPYTQHVVTVLREPQSHLYSWYRHVLRAPEHPLHDTVIRESVTFLDWLRDERFFEIVNNPQARNLGLPNEIPVGTFRSHEPSYHQQKETMRPREIDDWTLFASALDTLRNCSAVGVTEDLATFAQRMVLLVGGDETIEVNRLNEDVPGRPEITKEEAKAIADNTQIDRVLYSLALSMSVGAGREMDLATAVERRSNLAQDLKSTQVALNTAQQRIQTLEAERDALRDQYLGIVSRRSVRLALKSMKILGRSPDST
jgi:hypothetical protein